jgi:fatty-acid peroxygenase
MPPLPRDGAPNSTLALLSEGYAFIPNRCRRLGTDIFATRLMLRRAICMQGEEAARVFYEPDRFTRRSALPASTLRLLQDRGSVATLDGEAHRQRKRLFMALMTPDGIRRLSDPMAERWLDHLRRWEGMDRLVLHDAAQDILCRAVCRWAGIPLAEEEAGRRAREIAAMIDAAGAIGPRNWHATLLRARTERWLRRIVDRLRRGALDAPEGSAIRLFATHREPDGRPLDRASAAVELLNLLRPTVAVARFVTFAALALHEHPAWRRTLAGGGDEALEMFVQEVRRFYPFFPFVSGRVLTEFAWRGHRFARGD